MSKKHWLPFSWMPASWGLEGNAYLEAKAYYELDGEALDRRLVEIKCEEDDEKAKAQKLLDLDLKYHKIDPYQHATRMIDLQYEDENERLLHQIDVEVRYDKVSPYDAEVKKTEHKFENGLERDLELLRIDHEFGKIEKQAYLKRQATMKKEPWISFVDSGFNPEQGIDGVFFELDWNPFWIDFLKLHGFVGVTEEQIVEDWFSEVCRSYAQPSGQLPSSVGGYPMGFVRGE
jgi:hypothetical protein